MKITVFKMHCKIVLSTALLISPVIANAQSQSSQGKLDYAMQVIKAVYVDTVNEKKLTDASLRAMIKELDPHSVYIPIEEMREMNEPLVGKFEGIGIQFNIHDDTILVTQTIPGGPSEKLGIRAGDRIVKIDGINEANIKITNNDVLKKLRGDKGTKVTVSIFRRDLADLRPGGCHLPNDTPQLGFPPLQRHALLGPEFVLVVDAFGDAAGAFEVIEQLGSNVLR